MQALGHRANVTFLTKIAPRTRLEFCVCAARRKVGIKFQCSGECAVTTKSTFSRGAVLRRVEGFAKSAARRHAVYRLRPESPVTARNRRSRSNGDGRPG